MTSDKVVVDLIGQQTLRTAVTVDHKAICCPYSERASTIADVIQVRNEGVELEIVLYPQKESFVTLLVICVRRLFAPRAMPDLKQLVSITNIIVID